jgi:hypothetical protein
MMEEQKVENKYARGKIYKIVGGGLTYYGSTCEKTLAMRMSKHRDQKKQVEKGKRKYNLTSAKILDFDDCDIVLVENVPCQNSDELHARERFYIENNECVNRCVPLRTLNEYKIANKEKYKLYRDENKIKSSLQKCEYYKNNKEKIKQKCHERYERTKLTDTKEMITCECGVSLLASGKNNHENKSKAHIKFLNQKILI